MNNLPASSASAGLSFLFEGLHAMKSVENEITMLVIKIFNLKV